MDIADGSFEIMRARPRVVAIIIMTFVLPVRMFATWLQRDFLSAISSLDITTLDTQTGTFEGSEELESLDNLNSLSGIDTFLSLLTLPFLGVALTWLVLGWRIGEDRTVMECLLYTFRRSHKILAAFVLCKLIQLIGGVLLIIPFFVATVGLLLVAPVMAAEDLGPIASIRRSWELIRQRFAPSLFAVALTGLVAYLISNAFGIIPTFLAFLFGRWAALAFLVATTIGTMITTTFSVGVAVLLYFDLTTRLEGRDISERVAVLEAQNAVTI